LIWLDLVDLVYFGGFGGVWWILEIENMLGSLMFFAMNW